MLQAIPDVGGGSSATNEAPTAACHVSGSQAGLAAGGNSDVAALHKELEALGEQLSEEKACARAFDDLLRAKMKATLKRSMEEDIDRENEELRSQTSVVELRQKVKQRQQDLAKLSAYSRGLNAAVSAVEKL